jgi:hypothetical protein
MLIKFERTASSSTVSGYRCISNVPVQADCEVKTAVRIMPGSVHVVANWDGETSVCEYYSYVD